MREGQSALDQVEAVAALPGREPISQMLVWRRHRLDVQRQIDHARLEYDQGESNRVGVIRLLRIDSQSVATGPGGGAVGFDAAKKVKGRKRHLVVDTEGLLIGVVVTPASVQDPTGAPDALEEAKAHAPTLQHLWADSRYRGSLIDWAKRTLALTLEIVSREPAQKGFKLLPRRWVIEQSIAWLDRFRRLARDWEAASLFGVVPSSISPPRTSWLDGSLAINQRRMTLKTRS